MSRRSLAALALAAVLIAAPGLAHAGEQRALAPGIHASLGEIRALMDAQRNQQALRRLQALEQEAAGDAYAQAVVQQHLGHAHLAADEPDAAREAFEAALAPGLLPGQASQPLQHLLAQLCVQQGDYRQGLRWLRAWLREQDQPPARAYVLGAHACHGLEDYPCTARYLRQAIAAAGQPEAGWYALLAVTQMRRERWHSAQDVLLEGLGRFPGAGALWRLLADAYLRGGQRHAALAMLVLADHQGLLAAGQGRRIVDLYARLGIPEKAARLLAEGRESDSPTLRLQADLWLAARERERAIGVLRRLESRGGDPGASLALGRALLEQQRWDEAAQALERAAPALDDPGRAWLLAGIARYRAGEAEQALEALQRARGEADVAEQAGRWMGFVRAQGR